MKEGMKILKPGCGRGEHLRIFQNPSLDAYELDMSPEAPKLADDLNTSVCNLGSENLPLAMGFQGVEVYEFRQLLMT